jgi:hypothetical protein
MEEDGSKFFPRGITALIIYRTIPTISDFAGLAEYLRVLGKILSGERKIYRQRRNKVLKYSLDKLVKYDLVAKGKAPGTYVAYADYLRYLEFLKDNAPVLYERTKFYITFAIYEINRTLSKIDQRIAFEIGWNEDKEMSNRTGKPVYVPSERSYKMRRKFNDILSEYGVPKSLLSLSQPSDFEPYMGDSEQIRLLNSLFRMSGFNGEDIQFATESIVMNWTKQSNWIAEEINKFVNSDNSRELQNMVKIHHKFREAELEASAKVKGMSKIDYIWHVGKSLREDYTEKRKNRLGLKDPWWLSEFNEGMDKLIYNIVESSKV